MKITGNALLHASPEAAYRALIDPAVLVRTIPGCSRLEQIGEDAYSATVTAGVAAIKGTYDGEVTLRDQRPGESFILTGRGSGGPGSVMAEVAVRLSADGGGATRLDYEADATLGGMIGGIGQRMISGVAKKMATEFFSAVDEVLVGGPTAVQPAASPVVSRPQSRPEEPVPPAPEASAAAPATATRVFTRPQETTQRPSPDQKGWMFAALAGAAINLLGVLAGAWITRRFRR
jgi:hypothetical protein